MATEEIRIQSQDAARIRSFVEAGRFDSAGEVVSAGLQLLEARDRAEASKLEQLRAAAQKGIHDLESGHYTEVANSEELDSYLASIQERAMTRLKEAGADVEASKTQ